jgi:hypothetical protein
MAVTDRATAAAIAKVRPSLPMSSPSAPSPSVISAVLPAQRGVDFV